MRPGGEVLLSVTALLQTRAENLSLLVVPAYQKLKTDRREDPACQLSREPGIKAQSHVNRLAFLLLRDVDGNVPIAKRHNLGG